ncbi:NAD(P)/FAD-dependent oxidoreductase [Luteibacter sp. CQ10]|uniref:NAD(P)/FAD-dependent oxidoreductase n=1 Tax=Luteibacter sp. CQ10 TaxID=2805821 RepID=UPI0034A3AB2D
MRYDVIVIGGSYSGMAAALQLVRSHKSVLVIDAGERRNRFARHSHGFLSRDGADAADIVATARRQLEAYPTLSWIDGRVDAIDGTSGDFTVTLAEGGMRQGRRVLLATGVADQLPSVAGLTERWGKSVFHCPYCHGYELGRSRLGVIATGPVSLHQAHFLTEWGEVTLLVNQALSLGAEDRSMLEHAGVTIEDAPITTLEGHADVRTVDGRLLRFAGLFVATHCTPSGSLAESAGCALEDMPTGMGRQIRIDAEHKTSIPGVFACGDVARFPHSVSLAVAHGAWAGAQIHRSLFESRIADTVREDVASP